MRRLLILALLASTAGPAPAQHGDHSAHGAVAPPTDPDAGDAAEAQASADPHAGHQMPRQPAQADPHSGHDAAPQSADPHAGHQMPRQPAQADPHSGHDAAPQPADPHAGHDMGEGTPPPAPPVASPPPGALSGPDHAADTVFDPAAMAAAREAAREMHGGMPHYRLLVDRLELGLRDGRDGYAWDAQAWYGGDVDRLWIKSEGEGAFGESLERAEVQLLWSRAVTPFFNLEAGARYDFRPDPERAYLVLGIHGLAPYWLEIDAAAFVSTRGDVAVRVEAEYDQRITQRLILQPRAEVDFSLQDVPELGLGAGLSTAEAGLRLRYEIVPEFAPYVGVRYERTFGDTAGLRRLAGEDVGGWSLLLGARAWF